MLQRFSRAGLGLAVLFSLSMPLRAQDVGARSPNEISSLQHRLTTAGCYSGEVDGRLSAALDAAVKACPDQDPILRIESGMQVGPIDRIAVDAACQLMATASEDKSIKLWSLPDGLLQRTIRLPIGAGFGGAIDAVALSLDGRRLVAGGWDAAFGKGLGQGIYLIDLKDGTTRRLGSFPDLASEVAFSADGARIAIGLVTGGLRVLDAASGREIMADKDYHDRILGLAFARDGSLFAASSDGLIRHYSAALRGVGRVKAPSGRQPYGLALDPSESRLAVGYVDTAAVSILDAATLKLVASAETNAASPDNFGSLAWSADGILVAGGLAGKMIDGQVVRILRRFDPSGRQIGNDVPVAGNTIHDVRRCGHNIAFTAGGPMFGILDQAGTPRVLQASVTVDMRAKMGKALTISGDATAVRFGLDMGEQRPVTFDLRAGTLTESPVPAPELTAATVEGMGLANWKNGDHPTLNGKRLYLTPHEVSRSLAIHPSRTGFALGTEWFLRGYDPRGNTLWAIPAGGDAWGVDISTDGRIVVAAYGDGTIRWHRVADGQELLALFVHAPTKRWVAWTPTGYYMASPGGEDLIGWQINRGWNQEADFFPASRFRDRFNRPDVVRLVLTTLDEAEALNQANALAGPRHEDAKPLIERLPPVIAIRTPADNAAIPPGPVEIRYAIRLPSGGTVDRVEVFVDGAKVEARGLARVDEAGGEPGQDGVSGAVSVSMPAHDAVVSLVAYAAGKASDAARLQLKGTALSSGQVSADETALKPNLYALLVGVTHYDNKAYDLGYPAEDASGLAEALKAQEGKLYRHVEVKLLTDKEATSIGFKRGLLWLQKQATARDLAIVFAAGHGMTDAKGKFWFLTTDADPDALSISAVSRDDIADVLYDLPGKKLLFLDACHSGAALNVGARGIELTDLSAAVNDFAQAEGGVVAYAASTGKEFSLERLEWGHGAFTKALIEGFDGKADLLHKGTVTTATLDAYIEDRVKDLTGGAQHPVMTRPKTVPDFPIAALQ